MWLLFALLITYLKLKKNKAFPPKTRHIPKHGLSTVETVPHYYFPSLGRGGIIQSMPRDIRGWVSYVDWVHPPTQLAIGA